MLLPLFQSTATSPDRWAIRRLIRPAPAGSGYPARVLASGAARAGRVSDSVWGSLSQAWLELLQSAPDPGLDRAEQGAGVAGLSPWWLRPLPDKRARWRGACRQRSRPGNARGEKRGQPLCLPVNFSPRTHPVGSPIGVSSPSCVDDGACTGRARPGIVRRDRRSDRAGSLKPSCRMSAAHQFVLEQGVEHGIQRLARQPVELNRLLVPLLLAAGEQVGSCWLSIFTQTS